MDDKTQQDFQFGRRFLPEIKSIVGMHLIGEAPKEEDCVRNTDLIVLRLEAIRIACRIRKHKYFARWGDEFTIRANRPSGALTELSKIIQGWGDYIFYGFADEAEEHLHAWIIGDLKEFRLWFMAQLCKNGGAKPGELNENGDGSSKFRAFKITDMPERFIIGRSPLPT